MGGKRHTLARLNLLDNAHHRAANATENRWKQSMSRSLL